jgi:hypothetical protein
VDKLKELARMITWRDNIGFVGPEEKQPYSYLISTDGTNYYMKNGTTNNMVC